METRRAEERCVKGQLLSSAWSANAETSEQANKAISDRSLNNRVKAPLFSNFSLSQPALRYCLRVLNVSRTSICCSLFVFHSLFCSHSRCARSTLSRSLTGSVVRSLSALRCSHHASSTPTACRSLAPATSRPCTSLFILTSSSIFLFIVPTQLPPLSPSSSSHLRALQPPSSAPSIQAPAPQCHPACISWAWHCKRVSMRW